MSNTFQKTEWPKSNVKNVLAPYSDRMKKLLENPEAFYTPKKRPSGHDIGKGFGKDNGGAIPSSLINLPNTESNGRYDAFCKTVGASRHPARFPAGLPEFFIKMLTEPNDTVLDIFAGSNVTGQVSEGLERKWLSCELNPEYVACSSFRFMDAGSSEHNIFVTYENIMNGKFEDLFHNEKQHLLL
ncbi:site-specific DNA-methyltransferase [Acetobacter aceti]|nr:site-specific DNA-methyltransferase [Acetobacter aceti]